MAELPTDQIENECSKMELNIGQCENRTTVEFETRVHLASTLCCYYIHGACRNANFCAFSHDLRNAQPSNTCRYYLQGSCSYGERCRYDHIKPQKQKNKRNKNKKKETVPDLDSESFSEPLKRDWLDAPEFIPRNRRPKSYADIVGAKSTTTTSISGKDNLCPYAMVSYCPYGEKCEYIHGDLCEFCGHFCLHPTDTEQRKRHNQECVIEHEKCMSISFAIALSKDKRCGICMELILEKLPVNLRRFGILLNCSHVYCVSCISKWRQINSYDKDVVKACPECRVCSEFITPSKYWIESKEDKEKLVNDYCKHLSTKNCKYFKKGRGKCPFGTSCFYLHAYPDGRKPKSSPPRRLHSADGVRNVTESVSLWDFVDERNNCGATLSKPEDLESYDEELLLL